MGGMGWGLGGEQGEALLADPLIKGIPRTHAALDWDCHSLPGWGSALEGPESYGATNLMHTVYVCACTCVPHMGVFCS